MVPWILISLGLRGTLRSVAPWLALGAALVVSGVVAALPIRLAEPRDILDERLGLIRATAAAGLAWASVVAWPIRPPVALSRNLGVVPYSGFSFVSWTSVGRLLASMIIGSLFGLCLHFVMAPVVPGLPAKVVLVDGFRGEWLLDGAEMLTLLGLFGALGVAGDVTFGRAGATVTILASAGLPMLESEWIRSLLAIDPGVLAGSALMITRLTLGGLLILTTAWLSEYLPAGYPSLQETPKKLRKTDQ